jgi:hypothetical protein
MITKVMKGTKQQPKRQVQFDEDDDNGNAVDTFMTKLHISASDSENH